MNHKMSYTRIAEQALGTIIGSVALFILTTIINEFASRVYSALPLWLMGGVFAVAVALAIGWAPSRRLLGRVGRAAMAALRWSLHNWQLSVGLALLPAVAASAHLMNTPWAAFLILSAALATILLARYHHTVMIFSGPSGDFAHDPSGPWTLSVVCWKYPGWPEMRPARWIWIKDKPTDSEAQHGQKVWHRRRFLLLRPTLGLHEARLWLMVDDYAEVFVNGHHVGHFEGFTEPMDAHIAPYLKRGMNTLLVQVENAVGAASGELNPSGIIYGLRIT